jgi:hypothetical protein
MARRTLDIVNRSTHRGRVVDSAIGAMRQAIARQLHHVAAAWGEIVWRIVDDANAAGFEIALFDDDAQQSGDYGWHDVTDTGSPYARVFLNPILDFGGRWLRSSLSVSATVSHEVCELIGDPAVNRWAQTARGALYAIELCDPVESDSYDITLHDGSRVAVSDFVYPEWFNPFAPPDAVFDHTRVLTKPFEVARGGYTMQMSGGRVRNKYGRDYPTWRKATKRAWGSRTHARHVYGTAGATRV